MRNQRSSAASGTPGLGRVGLGTFGRGTRGLGNLRRGFCVAVSFRALRRRNRGRGTLGFGSDRRRRKRTRLRFLGSPLMSPVPLGAFPLPASPGSGVLTDRRLYPPRLLDASALHETGRARARPRILRFGT